MEFISVFTTILHRSGVYEIDIEYAGVMTTISPVKISVFDVSKIKVRDLKDGMVQTQMTFNGEFNFQRFLAKTRILFTVCLCSSIRISELFTKVYQSLSHIEPSHFF